MLNRYGLAGGVGLSAVALAGVVIRFLLIEKIGRRTLTVPPQQLCAVVLAIIGLWAGAPAPVVLPCGPCSRASTVTPACRAGRGIWPPR